MDVEGEERLLAVDTTTAKWRVLVSAPELRFELDARGQRIAWQLTTYPDTSFWAGALPIPKVSGRR
ncbi:MAG: hypothetical protein IV100_14890 [Myxococcales bacterium]|nr:hypothetical protein [Myxococcales bacterium]